MMEYDPEDYAAAERALLRKLTTAHTVHEFQRTIAAIAKLDGALWEEAFDAIEAIHVMGAIRLEAGVISADNPLTYIFECGEKDADAALEDARKARIANTEAPGEREAWERSMAPVRL